MTSKIGSAFGYLFAVAGMLYLFYTHSIFSHNVLVSTIQLLALALMAWSRMTFKSRSFHLTAEPTKGELVQDGPYRWWRHPIYAAAIYFSWSCLLGFRRLDVLLAAALITFGLYIRILLEERELLKVYPEYVEYSKKAKRLIPFVY